MPVCSGFFLNCHHVWSGKCTIVTFVLNCHYLEQKFSFLFKIHFLVRARTKQQQQIQNCCASDRPWQRSFWPNTTTNQQSRGTSLTSKIIANSLCIFILVDCYLAAFFSNLVKLPHHGHVDHDNRDFETAVQAIQLRPLG
jgi:hypothetical protein